jgi:hypothetical protein
VEVGALDARSAKRDFAVGWDILKIDWLLYTGMLGGKKRGWRECAGFLQGEGL